jgi:hypothetical protein
MVAPLQVKRSVRPTKRGAMHARATVAGAAAILLLSCVSRSVGAQQPTDESLCKIEWSGAAASCSWEVVEIGDPFVLRSPEGRLANEAGDRWPDGVDVAIELVAVDDHRVRHLARAQVPSGRFGINNVRDGHYCFRIGVRPAGWSCVQGRIQVTRSAPAGARLDVTVPLGR